MLRSSSSAGPQSVHKACSVLRALATHGPELGVHELARCLEMPKSTVHRLLAALEKEGLVEQDPHVGSYRLGIELLVLAGSLMRNSSVRRLALPVMTQLGERWHESVDLDVLREAEIVIIEQVPGQHVLSTGGTLATRMPAHCTSTGKVLLAHAGDDYVETHLPASLPTYTSTTISTRAALLKELARVRQQGYGASKGEYEDQVHSLAAPIHGHNGEVVAAMSVAGLAARIDAREEEIVAALKQKAAELSMRLGHIAGS